MTRWSLWKSAAEVRNRGHQEATAAQSQCLLFFAFLWERWGDRDLDLPALRSGDGDRDRLDRLGDFFLINKTYNQMTLR